MAGKKKEQPKATVENQLFDGYNFTVQEDEDVANTAQKLDLFKVWYRIYSAQIDIKKAP